jgi:hypothetical protein
MQGMLTMLTHARTHAHTHREIEREQTHSVHTYTAKKIVCYMVIHGAN